MTKFPETPQLPVETRLAEIQEIKDEAEQSKVELTTEVQQYIRTHLDAVQRKLAKQEPVTEDDLKFIQEVRLWVSLPENIRQKLPNIEVMNKEMMNSEALKRKINLKQWGDLLHVAEAAGKDKKWIDETFRFPGGGKIKTKHWDLSLADCTSLIYIPAGLEIDGSLYLDSCTSLISIPEDLKVRGDLTFNGCSSLTYLPTGLEIGSLDLSGCVSFKYLPEGLKVDGDLRLGGCTSLVFIPEGLAIAGNLYLQDCNLLPSLPVNIDVRKNLYLSRNIREQVKRDAERLKQEGKIKGNIRYKNLF